MKLNVNKVWAMALMGLFSFASCDDWTETESLDIHTPSIEEQNPALYAQYVEALNVYKATAHQVTIASIDNLGTAPAARNQHLTNLPDSIDYLCLNNVTDVCEANVKEIAEVRVKGTKVFGLMDFDAILADWKAILEEEAANATEDETTEEGTEGEEVDTEAVNAARFIEYCKERSTALLTACDELGLEGVVANFTGFDLNSTVTDEGIAAETARQGAFFDLIATWRSESKKVIFKGCPQNVMNKSFLSDCLYVVVDAHSAKNVNEMEYLILMSTVEGVPTDRFVMGVTTPYQTASGAYNGEMGDGSSAIVAAAKWAVDQSSAYTKSGIMVDAAEQDYFHIDQIYPNVREAINIMNPTVK